MESQSKAQISFEKSKSFLKQSPPCCALAEVRLLVRYYSGGGGASPDALKTICLAVSPSLKSYGIPGRARLFEVISKVREVNAMRKVRSPGGRFLGKSTFADELQRHPELEVGFVTATPRMARYLEYSTQIYNIYLKYIAPEDIHVYSIDEVFLDVTQYLKTYGMTTAAEN